MAQLLAAVTLGLIGLIPIAAWPAVINIANVLLALTFAAAVGCFFGFYPARKAARMDPIDALRYE